MDMCQTCIDFSVNLPSLHSVPIPLQLCNLLFQQLLPVEVRIQPFAAQQFLVRSPLGNNPVFQHENEIGIHHRRNTVADNDDRAGALVPAQRLIEKPAKRNLQPNLPYTRYTSITVPTKNRRNPVCRTRYRQSSKTIPVRVVFLYPRSFPAQNSGQEKRYATDY